MCYFLEPHLTCSKRLPMFQDLGLCHVTFSGHLLLYVHPQAQHSVVYISLSTLVCGPQTLWVPTPCLIHFNVPSFQHKTWQGLVLTKMLVID